jgi:2-methylcitrate dehydratase PrpD
MAAMQQDNPVGSATERLGSFVAAVSSNEINEALHHEAKRSLLNFFACALGAASEEAIGSAIDVLQPFSGPATATLVGRKEKLDAANACFINAVAANFYDFDDTHLNTVIHPTAPVAPVVLALSEGQGFSGREVIEAFVLGAEIECRIGNAVSPGHYARGWHITSTCGVFGAAAAAARLLRLSAEQTAHALGIAASQSSNLVENLATSAKNVGVGNSARNGLLAALFARKGYRAAPLAIEGPLGWARAMGDVAQMDEILGDLGTRWEFLKNTYKPYCCGIVFHTVVDACLQMRANGLKVDDIVSVTVSGDALLLARGDRKVNNERDARVSIHHCAAVALLTGDAGLSEFSPEVVARPDVVALRAKVIAKLDASIPTGGCEVIVVTREGTAMKARVLHARGSIQHPLSDAEIEAKAKTLAGRAQGCDISGLIRAVWSLDQAADAKVLMRSASAG